MTILADDARGRKFGEKKIRNQRPEKISEKRSLKGRLPLSYQQVSHVELLRRSLSGRLRMTAVCGYGWSYHDDHGLWCGESNLPGEQAADNADGMRVCGDTDARILARGAA